MLGRDFLVINSRSLATELVDKKSSVYADRPDIEMIKLMGWDFNLAFIRFRDPRRRKLRRVIQMGMGPVSASRIQDLFTVQSNLLLGRLLDHPEDFREHLLRFVFLM